MTGDRGQVKERTPIRSYKDLEVWQEGVQTVKMTYRLTQQFPREELYGLTSQLRRAVVSIPANIAEGCARNHRAEYRQFLYVALGSLAEAETLCCVVVELGWCSSETVEQQCGHSLMLLRRKLLALVRRLS